MRRAAAAGALLLAVLLICGAARLCLSYELSSLCGAAQGCAEAKTAAERSAALGALGTQWSASEGRIAALIGRGRCERIDDAIARLKAYGGSEAPSQFYRESALLAMQLERLSRAGAPRVWSLL